VKDSQLTNNRGVTLFTETDNCGFVNYRHSRPALLVSSTSWTGCRLVLQYSFNQSVSTVQ